MLKDIRLVSALIRQARIKFNYLCANLIEIFINISKIEWGQLTPPGGAIEQLGFDLLQHILDTDVEQFYHHATKDVRDHSYHLILLTNNLMDLMFLKHHHPSDTIIPDQYHVIDLINQVDDEASELAYYVNKAHCSAIKMKEATKWTKMAFPNGPDPVKHSEETGFNIAYIIGEVESNHQEEHMPSYCHYATHHNQCIHCSGTHASEDHHVSTGIPIVSNSDDTNVSPHQETNPSLQHKEATHGDPPVTLGYPPLPVTYPTQCCHLSPTRYTHCKPP